MSNALDMTIPPEAVARFWALVAIGAPDACWDWQGATFKLRGGYGYFDVVPGHGAVAARGRGKAHRIAYALAIGPVPRGVPVRHRCDRPICVNPGHLRLGTHADNVRDRVERGRDSRGEQHGHAKLTEAQVIEIRALRAAGAPLAQLAQQFGVTVDTVHGAATGRYWSHLPGAVAPTGLRRKLSPEHVRAIRARYAAGGISQAALAGDFGVTQMMVSLIVRGRSYTHVA